MRAFEVVRDPLWDNIRLDGPALALLDTPAVQRLRYIRQLGHAFLVYPGATHTRFEHALGACHLARQALAILEQRGELAGVPADHLSAVPVAALLHDIGHYPFSHALEEAGFLSHEELGVRRLREGGLGQVLEGLGIAGFTNLVGDLIQGRSLSPLQGLISGSLDLDKIDYLSRDARMCGVPGAVDVDRLLSSLTLVTEPSGRQAIGVHEKGVSAVESLLFAKYQMYRNVYWHHAVRSATCMFKRAVRSALAEGVVTPADVAETTDGSLMERLLTRSPGGLARAVHDRRLFKRALDLPASDVPADVQPWLWEDPGFCHLVEDHLARSVGLEPGQLLLDYPARSDMVAVDLPLRTRDGEVERLTGTGRAGHLGLPRIAGELYRSARRLRVFVARRMEIPFTRLMETLCTPAADLRPRLDP